MSLARGFTFALGCSAIGKRAVTVAFCIGAFESSGPAIPSSAAPIGRSLFPPRGGSAQRVRADRGSKKSLGLLGRPITIGCFVIAEDGAVITLLGCPVALVGRVVSAVGGSVSVLGCLILPGAVPASLASH
ncbi:MAG TPA: hypothetical protein VGB75_06765 [Jatrophihabitans sp.]|jgi:hypothetical protein|uniref:hypothetical protein n=1 Tax=Jatrophihabitans sp. TaxID=1932789 RepID=UPI002F08603A